MIRIKLIAANAAPMLNAALVNITAWGFADADAIGMGARACITSHKGLTGAESAHAIYRCSL